MFLVFENKKIFIIVTILIILCCIFCVFTNLKKTKELNDLYLKYTSLESNYKYLEKEYDTIKAKYDSVYGVPTDKMPIGMDSTYIGSFLCTAYCTEEYKHICGTGTGITASGKKVDADLTVAVDTSVIPLGTILYIEGVGIRIAQDTGGAIRGNKIDVAVETHEQALNWSGYGYHNVYVLGG